MSLVRLSVRPLGRRRRESSYGQLFAKLPGLEAPGDALLTKSVETCFIAV